MLKAYQSSVHAGTIRSDAHQLAAVNELDRLLVRLQKYAKQRTDSPTVQGIPTDTSIQPAVPGENGLQPSPEGSTRVGTPKPRVPRGVYLHGQVGTGKSMLMDMFQSVATRVLREEGAHLPSRRVHFNAFMQEVHQRVHHWKRGLLQKHGRDTHISLAPERDAIAAVAREVAKEATVLSFDEFQVVLVVSTTRLWGICSLLVLVQVNDIVDAVIMTKLFSTLFREGVVMVATSNQPPTQLYEVRMLFVNLTFHHVLSVCYCEFMMNVEWLEQARFSSLH
jgi:peroxisome-assembly ATPase